MCGIAGYVSTKICPENTDVLKSVSDFMRLRGPDGEGYYTENNVGLCHRRLSVIDIEGGIQPFQNDDGSLVIVFNGEIFNYKELRADLIQNGFCFHTESDTEVLLKLYECYGQNMMPFLNGFFAFCIYDRKNHILFLGRDRLGIKPLFYFHNGTDFAFASEMNALKIFPFFSQETINCDMLIHFFSYQYIPADRSIFQSIQKLPPACYGIFSTDCPEYAMKICRYWTLDFSAKTKLSYCDACDYLRYLMTDSVKKRMISDVSLGISLSGGMDSAIIAGLASENSNRELQCFSIGFSDSKYDERSDAANTAEYLKQFFGHGLRHHIKQVNPCDFDVLNLLALHCGEPFADSSMLPCYLLHQFSKEYITVSLGGDGADELFGGYERYIAVNLMKKFHAIPKPMIKALSSIIPAGGERTKCGRLKRFLSCLAEDEDQQYAHITSHGAEEILSLLLTPDVFGNSSGNLHALKLTASEISEMQMETDLYTYLPGDILVKADICSMAASVELRSPFLDYRVVEFAASLPLSWKLDGSFRKKILAESFSEYLPGNLPRRKKRGFGVPVSQWFRSEWKEKIIETLLDSEVANCGLFQKSGLETILQQHFSGQTDHGVILFSLLMYSLFMHHWNQPLHEF